MPAGDVGQKLKDAEAAARLGQMDRVTPILKELGIDADPTSCRPSATSVSSPTTWERRARSFTRRIDRDPKSFVGALGMASTALLSQDWDLAGAHSRRHAR